MSLNKRFYVFWKFKVWKFIKKKLWILFGVTCDSFKKSVIYFFCLNIGSRRARLPKNPPTDNNRRLASCNRRGPSSLRRERYRQQRQRRAIQRRLAKHRSYHIELQNSSTTQRPLLQPRCRLCPKTERKRKLRRHSNHQKARRKFSRFIFRDRLLAW